MLQTESYKKGIILSTGLNIVGKGIVFLNSLLIAYLFGTTAETDVYFFLITIINLVCGFINVIDLFVLIPESMRIREHEGLKEENRYLNFFIRLYGAIGLLIGSLIFLFPIRFFDLFSKFPEHILHDHILLLSLSAVVIPMQLLTNLLVSILASHKYFTMPILVSIINSMLSIIAFIFLRQQVHMAAGLIAMCTGFAINLILLLGILRRKLNWSFFGSVRIPSMKNFREIGMMELLYLPITLRSSLVYYLISGLGIGVLSSMNYATQVTQIPEILILSQVAAVAGIKITELSAKNKPVELNELFQKTMNFLMFAFIPVAFIMAIFSQQFASIFFSRGNMTDDAIDKIGFWIVFIIILLPAKAYIDFFASRLITAGQKLPQFIFPALIMHFLIAAMIYFSITSFGVYGYLVCMIIVYWLLYPVFFHVILKRNMPFINMLRFYRSTGIILLVNLAVAMIIYGLLMSAGLHVNKYLAVVAGTAVYGGILWIINRKVNLDPTFSQLLGMVASRFSKKLPATAEGIV